MPGNGVGDRVHNFFAQENLSQGHHSQSVDENWPTNDKLWAGSHKQISVLNPNPNYNPQQSEFEIGHSSQRVPVPHGFNFTQMTERPKYADFYSQSQQPNQSGYMYGRPVFRARPDETNFLGASTDSDQSNVNQRVYSVYESQQEGGSEQISKNSVRPDPSDAQGSFDLFEGQHQMNSQHPVLLQHLQQQQSGFSEMQQLQQQLMLRKMQELQRQKDLRQQDVRLPKSVNRASPSDRQASGSHSHGLNSGNPASDSSGQPWPELTAGNTNWLQRASPAMQGSSAELVLSPEQGQVQCSMGLIHQQGNQSLYGVPVSSSRGHLNQYPHIATDNASNQQIPTYKSSFSGNQYDINEGQGSMHGGTSVNTEGLPGKSLFGHMSGQGSNSGIKMEHIQQLKAMQQNVSVQDYQGPQNLNGPLKMVQDKSAMETTSSHGTASLDPDEEKILFGSDDNIWDAFGSDGNMDGGAYNLLDGNEFAGGLPSIQSGSWSALMQSAVAEASSSGLGLQEEWTSLKFQNPEPPLGTPPSTYEDRGKQETVLGDVNLPNASAFSFGSVPLADAAGMNVKYHSNMGLQHHGQKIPYEDDERLHISSSVQMNQHASGGTSQPNYKQNSWNPIESVPPPRDITLTFNENDNSLQQSQSNDRKRIMHEKIGQDNGIWSVRSLPNSVVEHEPVKTSIVSTQISREGFAVNNTASVPNLGNMQGGNLSSQFPHNSHHLNYWKHVDSSVKSIGGENSEKSPHLSKVPQVSESSFNSSDREDLMIHEMESSSKREYSNESHRSGSPHLPESLRSFPGSKQSLSNQTGRKTSGPRKFQYHPMGNLDDDVEMAYGTRQSSNIQAMSLQHSRGLRGQDHGNFGHTETSGQVTRNSAEVGKGRVPDLEGFAKGSDDTWLKGMVPRHVPNMFAPFDRSVGLFTLDKTSQPSQNMLELLHKVDQPRDAVINFNSSERNLSSEMPGPENSDGSSGGPQRSQSSNSQGFSLQLGPPSEKLSLPTHTSQKPMHAVSSNSLSQALAPSNIRNKGHAELSPLPPPQETSNSDFKNDKVSIRGQTASQTLVPNFSSGLSITSSRSRLKNHQMIGAKGHALANLSSNRSFDRHAPQIRKTDEAGSRPLSHQPAEGCLPNAVLGMDNLEDKEAEKRGNMLSMLGASSLNSQVFASGVKQSTKDSTSPNVSSGKVDRAQMTNGPLGKESVFKSISDASSVNPIATQSDLEAFGRALKPSSFHQNYSLLNQMRAMKNTDIDPTNRVLKRLKGSDNILGGQEVAPWSGQPNENNNMVVDGSNCRTTVSPGDFHALSFSKPADNVELNVSSQPGNVPSKDELMFGHNESQSYVSSNITTSVKAQHSHISPQMAPSWFDQFGTFKPDQMLPRGGVHIVKSMEQPFRFGRLSGGSSGTHTSKEQTTAASDTGPVGIIWKNPAPPLLAIEKFSSSPLNMDAGAQKVETLRPKKRKHVTDDLHPWLEEVTGGFKILQDISTAAIHWSKAANRLMEKFEDNCEVVKGIRTMGRPSRRLILTTQLMQQLFHPPPTRILFTDASSTYESVAYYVARMALGDACNLVSSSRSYSSISHGAANFLSDRNQKTERSDEHLSEVMQDFMSKTRQLENDFMRLDMRVSILDLRLECQELEKLSVINRFARFHVRGGQADGEGEAPLQPCPQRYVTALPLPNNLPHNRVHCLSL